MEGLKDHTLLLEIADRCYDVNFDDFNKTVYQEAIYRSIKKIALKYDILNRILTFNSKIIIPPQEKDNPNYVQTQKQTSIALNIKSFHNETRVIINNVQYNKTTKDTIHDNDYEYHLYYANNKYMFNYSPRSTNDSVIIHYTSDINVSDFDEENAMPVLPPKFEDEIINRACTDMAKRGIAKYKGDKEVKWTKIFKMYSNEKINVDVQESTAWTHVKPYMPI